MKKLLLNLFGVVLGAVVSAFLIFQILFLAKVLPHGGI